MPDYLIHFNRNHDPKTGRFAPGDGDGDGQVHDNGVARDAKKTRRNAIIGTVAAGVATAGLAGLMIMDAVNTKRTSSGKSFTDNYRDLSISEAADWAKRMGGLTIE